MATYSVLEANGLHTSGNTESGVPRGAFLRGDNVVIREKNLVEPRRGQKPLTYTFGTNPFDRPEEVAHFGETPIVAYDGRFLAYDSGSAFVDISGGPFEPPAPDMLRMKFAEANEKLFFTTALGIKALENSSAPTLVAIGLPKPFNVETRTALYNAGSATPNWMSDDNQLSVRATFIKRDDRNNVQEGPPSEAAILVNTTGTGGRAVRVHIGLPAEVIAGHGYRIYLTETSGGDDVHPGDEHWLVFEGAVTSTDITAGYIEKTITNIEAVLSDVPLYTNPNSGDGLTASKLPPPRAKDLCYWDNRLWGFGVTTKKRVEFTLLGVDNSGGAGTGLDGVYIRLTDADGNSLVRLNYQSTIATPTYDTASGDWWVPLDFASSSASDRVKNTAKALVWTINISQSAVRAYYVDAADGWPGQIVVEEAGFGSDGFGVMTGTPSQTTYSPAVAVGGDGVIYARSDDWGHWAWHTEADEPEAWPLANFIPIGKRGKNILRGVPLRDSIVCWMDDGTIHLIRGRGGNYRVDQLESTANLVGPDTIDIANNQLWAFTDQGFAFVTEAGVGLVGLPVDADTRTLFGPALDTAKLRSFGFAYETERLYCVWVPERAGQTYCSLGYLYNYVTKSWTRWVMDRNCGRVNPVTKTLYMGDVSGPEVWKERKTLTQADYCDEEADITIDDWEVGADFLGPVITTSAGSAGLVEVGDVLSFPEPFTEGAMYRVVTEVSADAAGDTLTLDDTLPFAADPSAATLYKAYECAVEWLPTSMGNPGVAKGITDFSLYFQHISMSHADASLSSDISFSWARSKEFGKDGFGDNEWGEYPWGDPAGPHVERMTPATEKRSCTFIQPRLVVREAFAFWKLMGYAVEHDGGTSERTKR